MKVEGGRMNFLYSAFIPQPSSFQGGPARIGVRNALRPKMTRFTGPLGQAAGSVTEEDL
jgi:hypothetical protein